MEETESMRNKPSVTAIILSEFHMCIDLGTKCYHTNDIGLPKYVAYQNSIRT